MVMLFSASILVCVVCVYLFLLLDMVLMKGVQEVEGGRTSEWMLRWKEKAMARYERMDEE